MIMKKIKKKEKKRNQVDNFLFLGKNYIKEKEEVLQQIQQLIQIKMKNK